MLHRTIFCPAILAIAIASAASASTAEDDIKKLFDGSTLKGWRGDPAHWCVKDGAIVGSTKPNGRKENTFLIADGEYQDFILRIKFKHSSGGSGIQLRSRLLGKPGEFRVTGYQADIGGGDLGTFSEEQGRGTLAKSDFEKLKPFISRDDWNTYEIKAIGERFDLQVNGRVTARYSEEEIETPRSGLIALQLQAGAGMEIYFKDIEIREIKD
jgi:hypothetical protein